MNWANSSLPEPLSPVNSTDASVGATLRAREIASRNAGASPRMRILSLFSPACSSACDRRKDSRADRITCAAWPTRMSSCTAENGLGKYAQAPLPLAWRLDASVAFPVTAITRVAGFAANATASSSRPGMSLMYQSTRRTSNTLCRSRLYASCATPLVATQYPSCESTLAQLSRSVSSSSTIRIRIGELEAEGVSCVMSSLRDRKVEHKVKARAFSRGRLVLQSTTEGSHQPLRDGESKTRRRTARAGALAVAMERLEQCPLGVQGNTWPR